MKYKVRILTLTLISMIVFLLSTCRISLSTIENKNTLFKINFFKPLIDSLVVKGVDSIFLYTLITNSKIQFQEKYIKININTFLQRTKPDYIKFVNWRSIQLCKFFISENFDKLLEAEERFTVPKEVITSILWIETKFGSYVGNNNVASVFFSTAMANKPEYIEMNLKELGTVDDLDSTEYISFKEKIRKRAITKSKWAFNELIALDKIKNKIPTPIDKLEGSWAGAFGFSQFLPSSYLKWALDGNNDGVVDLFNMDDAIFSVANYLKSNGWNDDFDAQYASVFHYNNSDDYVTTVLKLASRI